MSVRFLIGKIFGYDLIFKFPSIVTVSTLLKSYVNSRIRKISISYYNYEDAQYFFKDFFKSMVKKPFLSTLEFDHSGAIIPQNFLSHLIRMKKLKPIMLSQLFNYNADQMMALNKLNLKKIDANFSHIEPKLPTNKFGNVGVKCQH
jgi:hypothetical protein